MPSIREVIKGLLGQDKMVRRFHAVYNRPKKEREELAKQEGRDAYYARDWAQDREGIVTFKGLTYVPNVDGLRAEVIKTNHDLPWAGHYGVRRTLDLIARKYFWPRMQRDVIQYVKDCTMYTKTKLAWHKPRGTAQSLPTPQAPWTDIALDFIVALPESPKSNEGKKYSTILVIVDRFSKMARYIPVRNTIDAAQLANVLVHKLILRGAVVPSSIVSDRGQQFTLKFWSAPCYHLKIKQRLSTVYHPQTDGQTERQNQTLEQYLQAYVNYHQSDWSRRLVFAEFAFNNSIHVSIGMTSLMAAKGRHAQVEMAAPRPSSKLDGVDNPAAQQWVRKLLAIRREMTDRWKEAAATQRAYADRRMQPKEYAVGNNVWLSAKNIRTGRPSRKLDLKYYGPFPVIERIGKQAYKLKLKDSVGRIHPVFHVTLLEPSPPSARVSAEDSGAQLEVENEEQEWTVEEIRDSRVRWLEL